MKRYIIANWKMNESVPKSIRYAGLLRKQKKILTNNRKVILGVPHTLLSSVSEMLRRSPIGVAAQDVYFEENGPYTGQISASLVKDAGASYIILGHSERRHIIGESENEVAKKIRVTLAKKLTPILCIGETLQEKKAGKTREVVRRQLKSALQNVSLSGQEIIVAYEPVWAISTSKSSRKIKPHEINDSMIQIKKICKTSIPKIKRIKHFSCIYGGSVNEKNAKKIFSYSSVEGVLVGGASLDLNTFQKIIEAA